MGGTVAEEEGGFFSRWSRRKVDTRQGQAIPAPVPASAPVPAAVPAAPLPASAAPPSAADASVPTLDDARQLTAQSDFRPFVARGVAPEVRNAALKQLFADPHFNVMDGLDIYIDDYSKPSPLPAELLKKMVSAQFMKLVDEEPEAPGVPPPGAGSVAVDPGAATAAAGAAAAEPALAAPAPIPATPMPATPDLVTPDKATPVAVETPPATPTPDPS